VGEQGKLLAPVAHEVDRSDVVARRAAYLHDEAAQNGGPGIWNSFEGMERILYFSVF
jgi:hypothetical protein